MVQTKNLSMRYLFLFYNYFFIVSAQENKGVRYQLLDIHKCLILIIRVLTGS